MFIVDRPQSEFSIASKDLPLFDFIKVSSEIDDWTLEATARALLYGRAEETVTVRVNCVPSNIKGVSYDVDDAAIRESFEKELVGGSLHTPGLYVWGWRNTLEMQKWFEWAEKNFTTVFQGFRELMDVGMYIKRSINAGAHVYIDETNRVTHVFCKDITQSILRVFQAIMPRFLPWYFAGKPLAEAELQILRSITKDESVNYIAALEAVSAQKGVRNAIMSEKLKGLATAGIRASLASYESRLRQNAERIQDNLRDYEALMLMRDELNTSMAGYEARLANAGDGGEFADYISRSKAVEVVDIYGNIIEIVVHTCLSNYDPDRYARYSRNDRSSIFGSIPATSDFGKNLDKTRLLLNEVFSPDPVIKVHMCGYYCLSMSGSVNTQRSYEYPATCKNEVPNPHLHYHSCLGDNARYIREPLSNGDLITAVEQCIASAGSVNIDEGVSIGPFIRDILKYNIAPFELPDGQRVNATKALEWIEKERSKS